MRISAKADYAIRALLLLAEHAPDLVKLDVLSAEQGLPRRFSAGILRELARHGLVRSRRGAEGGHALARPAAEVTIGDVVRVVDGPFALVHGEWPPPVAYRGAAAHLPEVWLAMDASIAAVLDGTTLEQVLSGRLPAHVGRLAAGPDRVTAARPSSRPE